MLSVIGSELLFCRWKPIVFLWLEANYVFDWKRIDMFEVEANYVFDWKRIDMFEWKRIVILN